MGYFSFKLNLVKIAVFFKNKLIILNKTKNPNKISLWDGGIHLHSMN